MQDDSTSSATPLIIVGMHRSGTSLVTSLLQSAGMHVGDRLVAADEGNSRGYFENIDFHMFHMAVLKSQGLHPDGWTLQENIDLDNIYVDEAKRLINRNSTETGVWGWKDPRTALLLDFWATLLPEAKFLILYRAPWEVIDSLYRRGDKIFQESPQLAIKCWQHYNQKILNFLSQNSEKSFLVNINEIIHHADLWFSGLKQRFNLKLSEIDKSLIDTKLIKTRDLVSHHLSSINQYYPRAIKIYSELEQISWKANAEQLDDRWKEHLSPANNQIGFLKDWIALRRQEYKNNAQLVELEQKNSEICNLESQIRYLKNEIALDNLKT